MMDEPELLARFVADGSPEAFAELVRRNIDLVYTAARRQLHDAHLADDVTQAVFILFARKAASIKGSAAGWLIAATYYACRDARKMASKRQYHERRAAQMRSVETPPQENPAWENYAPILDAAMARLRPVDRDAVAMRYLRGMSLDQVARCLGISEMAAQKRVNRSIARLREILAVKTTAPAAAALATELAARGSEAAPVKLTATIIGSTATAAKGTAAAAIAHKAALAMSFAKAKVAALVLVAVAVVGSGAAVTVKVAMQQTPTTPPSSMAAPIQAAAQPVPATLAGPTAPPESQMPGEIQVARWDVVLSHAGALDFMDMARPVHTASKVYQAYLCNGAKLRQLVAAKLSTPDVEATGEGMRFATSLGPNEMRFLGEFGFNGTIDEPGATASVLGGWSGERNDQLQRIGPNGLQLKLEPIALSINMAELVSNDWQYGPSASEVITYDGQLNAGDALAFLGRFAGPTGRSHYHLVIWETFRASQDEMVAVANQNSAAWWCRNGPAAVRKIGDAAMLWAKGTLVMQPLPGFTKSLEDGKTVNLVALCRPSRWPCCWWDPAGNPTGPNCNGWIPMNGDGPPGLWAMVWVYGDPQEWTVESPVGRPRSIPGQPYRWPQCAPVPDEKPQLNVGVLVGPWKEVTRLKLGQTKIVDGIRFTVDHPITTGAHFLVRFRMHGNLQDEYGLTAVGDGKELEFQEDTSPIFERDTSTDRQRSPNFYDLSLKKVDYFRVVKRKRQWVTFDGFATEPRETPRLDVTHDEAVAAAAQSEQEAKDRQARADAAKRLEEHRQWAAIPLDPTTPLGAIRICLAAADRGDLKSVRGMIFAKDLRIAKLCDAGAAFAVACRQLRAKAVKLFGETAVEEQLGNCPLFSDIEQALMEDPWKPTADGKGFLQAGNDGSAVMRRDGQGHLYMDLDGEAKELTVLQSIAFQTYLQTLTARCPEIDRLLSNRTVTMQQLKAGLSNIPQPPN